MKVEDSKGWWQKVLSVENVNCMDEIIIGNKASTSLLDNNMSVQLSLHTVNAAISHMEASADMSRGAYAVAYGSPGLGMSILL